jgi:putative thioredoxin
MHEPGSARAAVIAAHATVWKDTVRAAELVMSIEEHSEHFPVADAIRTIARMRALSIDPTVLPDGPSREHYIAGLRALAGCDFLSAVDEFLRVVRTDRKYDDDGARKACIAIFRLLGDEHEVTRSRRRDFSSALHS